MNIFKTWLKISGFIIIVIGIIFSIFQAQVYFSTANDGAVMLGVAIILIVLLVIMFMGKIILKFFQKGERK